MRTQPMEWNKTKLQAAASATGDGEAATVGTGAKGGFAAAVIQLTGTFTATVTFEGTVDGTNWVAIEGASVGDSTALVTTATATGAWRFNVMGLAKIRARVSAYTSGNVTAVAGLLS